MNSMIYLMAMTIKNQILELKRKPTMLCLYVVIIASLVLVVVASILGNDRRAGVMDITWLKGVYFVLLTIFFGMGVSKGLSTGGSFFGMCDVNFLFVAPINPKRILVYGLIKQTGMLLLTSVFILYQAQTLRNMFGIGLGDVFLLFLGFILHSLACEALALFIYSYTNNSIRGKNIVKVIAVAIFLPVVIRFLFAYYDEMGLIGSAVGVINSSLLNFVPIVGWVSQSIVSLMAGDFMVAVLFLGLTIALVSVLILFVVLGKSDYYEDVLCATEVVFQKKVAKLEGNLNGMSTTNRKIKVTDTGIIGSGAKALFGKHLRESMRGNRFVIIDTSSLIYALISGAFALLMSKGNMMMLMLLGFSMYLQTFLIGTGLGLKELFSHYIFMIPESSFAKIFWSNVEAVFKTLIESILMFVVAGIILGESPLLIVACIGIRTLFSMVLIGINMLSMRIFGDTLNRGVLLALYFFFVILTMLPGVVGAVVIGVIFAEGAGLLLALGIIMLWESLLAAVCMYFARGVLSGCDMCTVVRKQ